MLNPAETSEILPIVRLQVVDVPEQAPPQPEKLAPPEGAAVNVTYEPMGKSAKHAAPPEEAQFTPGGEDVTLPLPVTVVETDPVVGTTVVELL